MKNSADYYMGPVANGLMGHPGFYRCEFCGTTVSRTVYHDCEESKTAARLTLSPYAVEEHWKSAVEFLRKLGADPEQMVAKAASVISSIPTARVSAPKGTWE